MGGLSQLSLHWSVQLSKFGSVFVLLALAFLVALESSAQPLSAGVRKKLDNDIRYLVSQHQSYGQFAVAVVDSEGVVSQVNGEKPYPLASVFKLPLLLAILDAQQAGKFPSLGSTLRVTQSDQCIGSGRLASQGLGASVTVQKAAELMMSISDNTATDLLFRTFGCQNLDPWLEKAGFRSSEILLTNRQAWLLSLGRVPGWPQGSSPESRVARWDKLDRAGKLELAGKIEQGAANLSLAQFQAIEDASTGTQTEQQDNMLATRLDNKMSALDLAKLLVRLDQGDLLSSSQRRVAFNILAGQKYHSRLPAKLSTGTEIYHKTGTLSGVRNDAGLLYVKNQEAGVAVVFLSQYIQPGAGSKVDRLAGQVAKLVETAYMNP
jgi:beta-lactamase class A